MGAGISHWLSFHGKSSLADWDAIHYAESPYELTGRFQNKLAAVVPREPEHTDSDSARCRGPRRTGRAIVSFYRALKDKRVPAELIVYPREDHAIKERSHLLDMSKRVLAWFRKYL